MELSGQPQAPYALSPGKCPPSPIAHGIGGWAGARTVLDICFFLCVIMHAVSDSIISALPTLYRVIKSVSAPDDYNTESYK